MVSVAPWWFLLVSLGCHVLLVNDELYMQDEGTSVSREVLSNHDELHHDTWHMLMLVARVHRLGEWFP
jgi:hypothetical protein